MKIGLVSDSLREFERGSMMKKAAELGVQGIELNTGNWSTAPHCDLAELIRSSSARDDLLGDVREAGVELISLNCNGNPLHPTDRTQDDVLRKTIELAGLLGVRTVCTMSGLPGAGPDEKFPNWITSCWPLETQEILDWQWRERLVPYWKEMSSLASAAGVDRIALELYPCQNVYNVPTLLRLREEVGPVVGANLDPSHLMWMGADPLDTATALGSAIHHVHAKDTAFVTAVQARTGVLETIPFDRPAERAWNYVTLGYGRDESWWKTFCYRLKLAGYDGWLSIEHEDPNMPAVVGVRKSVDLLKTTILN